MGSMDLGAGVEGQDGHMGLLLTNSACPLEATPEVVLRLNHSGPSFHPSYSPGFLSSSLHHHSQVSSFPGTVFPRNPFLLSFLGHTFSSKITLSG